MTIWKRPVLVIGMLLAGLALPALLFGQAAFSSPSWEVVNLVPSTNQWAIRGSVYNHGDKPGATMVHITGSQGGKTVVSEVVATRPRKIPSRSEGVFEAKFGYVGDAKEINFSVQAVPER